MPVTYQMADEDIKALTEAVLVEHYPDLVEAELAVDVMVAFGPVDRDGQTTGPAVKVHGVQALASVQVISLKDRVAGLGDVRIVLDGDRWPDLSDARRRALIDHELHHVELQRDDGGAVRTDDAERPLVKLRPHDFELGGFWAMISRHGDNAAERVVFEDIAAGMETRKVFDDIEAEMARVRAIRGEAGEAMAATAMDGKTPLPTTVSFSSAALKKLADYVGGEDLDERA